MTWFRMYTEVLNDPKAQRLSGDDFKGWVNLLCLAKEHDGAIPPLCDVAFALRISEKQAEKLLAKLSKSGLIDETETGLEPHNWGVRQYKSDVSTERVKRFRKRHTKRQDAVSETPPETDTESDTEKEDANASSDARDEFAVWYSEYPNKVGKAHALKAFKAARKKADLETLMTGLRRYVSNKPADRQWCNPATWLNGERWLDQEAAPAVNQAAAEDEVDRMILEAAREADRRNDQQQRTDHGAVEPLELAFRPANGEDHQRPAELEVRRTGGGLRGIATALPALGTGGRH